MRRYCVSVQCRVVQNSTHGYWKKSAENTFWNEFANLLATVIDQPGFLALN